MPTVRVPTVLRKHTDGQARLDTSGSTVGEALREVAGRHPGLTEQLFEDGQVRGFVNVYVDDEDIRYLDGLDTPVRDDTEIAIMPAVAGGAQPPRSGGEHARRPRSAGGSEV